MKPRICVNLIVRNESHVILRVLNNLLFNIDLLAILDNGSDDDTIYKARKFMFDNKKPGGVISRPWFGFGVTRTESLRYAEYLITKFDKVTDVQHVNLFIPNPESERNLSEMLPKIPNLTGAITFETFIIHRADIKFNSSDISHEIKRYDARHFLFQHIEQPKNPWYILFIDADNMICPIDSAHDSGDKFLIDRSKLTADQYMVQTGQSGMTYESSLLIKMNIKREWYWDMPVHEFLGHNEKIPIVINHIAGAYMYSGREGARNRDKLKYLNDALVLERELIHRPDNGRIKFYIGNSYKDSLKHGEAIRWYKKVIADKSSWIEERYVSAANIAQLLSESQSQRKRKKIIKYWRIAHDLMPARREAAYHLVRYYKEKEMFRTGFELASTVLNMNSKPPILFNRENEVLYLFLDDASICAFYIGDYTQAEIFAHEMLKIPNINSHQKTHVIENLQMIESRKKN
jgi:glycosyltransferase involved in cell wall biosynthesis